MEFFSSPITTHRLKNTNSIHSKDSGEAVIHPISIDVLQEYRVWGTANYRSPREYRE